MIECRPKPDKKKPRPKSDPNPNSGGRGDTYGPPYPQPWETPMPGPSGLS